MNLVALPAFADNYIWMLHDGVEALVVDPGEAAPVLQALDRLRLSLGGILVTHRHDDHIGGVEALRPRLAGPVYAPLDEPVGFACTPVADGERLHWRGLAIEVIGVPGHTAHHAAYFLPARGGEAPCLFCGDTLFSVGCGRLFEGTPAQMQASLARLAALPDDTRVCCAHEYTLSNLRFALAAEPDNAELAAHQRRCQDWRAAGRPTLPSTIALERRINPFLRCEQASLIAAARQHGAAGPAPLQVFTALREWKNQFR